MEKGRRQRKRIKAKKKRRFDPNIIAWILLALLAAFVGVLVYYDI